MAQADKQQRRFSLADSVTSSLQSVIYNGRGLASRVPLQQQRHIYSRFEIHSVLFDAQIEAQTLKNGLKKTKMTFSVSVVLRAVH